MKTYVLYIFVLLFAGMSSAQSVYYVNNSNGADVPANGTGNGSSAWKTIGYALNHVNNPGSDSIVIHISNGEYNLLNKQIKISQGFKNLTLLGENTDKTIVEANSDSSLSTSRVFDVYPGNKVQFVGMTIRYGKAASNGGGVLNDSGIVKIEKCKITGNYGGVVGVGGGVANVKGYCVIDNSTISHNSTSDTSYGGGVGSQNGTLIITNSTIAYNSSPGGGGIAVISYKGNAVFNMTNSTISENTATFFCGGIRIDRWDNTNYSVTANITNCTIFKNSSTGLYGIGGIGILYGTQPGSKISIKNSIIAGNSAQIYPDIEGEIISGDYNLIEDTTGSLIKGDTLHNIYVKSPMCSTLALNHSLNGTMTCAIDSNSPARDAIPADSSNGAPMYDQRGAPRKGNYDIGAFEFWNDSTTFPVVTAIARNLSNAPKSFLLYQNYPNPFNPSTMIQYNLPASGFVKLAIYNSLGQEIAVPVKEYESAGLHNAEFNAASFSSGIYFYRLQAGNYVMTKKMILLK